MIRPRIPRGRRGLLSAGGALVAVAVVVAVLVSAMDGTGRPAARQSAAYPDGLPHTRVTMSAGDCGQGWTDGHGGDQVFDVHNASSGPAEVDLVDPGTGAVYGEVEGLAPGTTRPLQVTLGGGSYAFKCLPDDADAVTGPTVRIAGHAAAGPAAVPVSQHDLIPPTIAYQQWIGGQMGQLADRVGALKDAVDSGDLDAARAAWLPAHLVYERMGAAYGTFGDADKAINGTTAGLPRGSSDPRFTGFHRIEYGLWHGQSAEQLRLPADQLGKDVDQLRSGWSQARMDPAQLGLRAHEILENTVQFELTGRTDYGSGSNLATARANLDGTRTALGYLRPLLTAARLPQLPRVDAALDRMQRTLDGFETDGHWTALNALSRTQRERVDADAGAAVEQLAAVAAVCDVRRTS
ncbi:EfeM/EfeO family lipoprotein [Streptomyces silvisoli]|uniref:EfeM/EfeO family lipoprotein n=1 Tax=Streptomyces silvisoli TaxID=3034235 RepID=A0ABT5ZSL1_9ACTN|nr:EfeM/EfeO family lipoprotein [Streptomyces silvisoli]MDF3292509.1 EfeM/EfeO family lipoprotein [Streptomyces silvisoli]